MTQFIRKLSVNLDKDIDIISSTSKPNSRHSNDGLIECINETKDNNNSSQIDIPPPESSSSLENYQTMKLDEYQESPLPTLLYGNYTFNTKSLKEKEKQLKNVEKDNPVFMNNQEIISPENTNQSFKSAFDTYNHPPTTSELTHAGYELETQEPFNQQQHQQQDDDEPQDDEQSVDEEIINPRSVPILAPGPIVTMTILTKLWKFFKYLSGLPNQQQNYSNERQPLLSSPNSPYDNDRGIIHSPHYGYNDDLEGQDQNYYPPNNIQGPAYNLLTRYRLFFIIITIIAAIIILAVVLATGDSKLLVIIIKALLCYLLGSSAQNLLGEGFCPIAK